MKTVSYTFTAGQRIEVNLVGNYFRLVSTVAGVDIDFMQNGAVFATAQNMEGGFYTKPVGGFTSIAITSATAQTVKVAVGIGDGGYDRMVGEVALLNSATMTQNTMHAHHTGDLFIPANASRRYLLIHNKDPAVKLMVNLAGQSIYDGLHGLGIDIAPGEKFVMEGARVPTSAITLLFASSPSGEVMHTPNVVYVEG